MPAPEASMFSINFQLARAQRSNITARDTGKHTVVISNIMPEHQTGNAGTTNALFSGSIFGSIRREVEQEELTKAESIV